MAKSAKNAELTDKINQIDASIRAGRGAFAQDELEKLVKSDIPREVAPQIAWLSWRASVPELGARLLARYVRPSGAKAVSPTVDEKAEYAMCLTKMGLASEALRLLKKLPASGYPKVVQYRGMSHMHLWEYEAAIPPLRVASKSSGLDPYQRLVAAVNLCASYVFTGKFPAADILLEDILKKTTGSDYLLLHANALELSSESLISQKHYRAALKLLDEAQKELSESNSLHQFIVGKWKAIANFCSDTKSLEFHKALKQARSQAEARGHWNSVRECDRYEALATQNSSLHTHLYFGTPYDGFRQAVIQEGPTLPSHYDWKLGGKDSSRILDVREGTDRKTGLTLKTGHSVHRLLLTLTSDFYRAFSLGELYAEIFAGEEFDPITSPPRVYQALTLLRQWFEECGLPLVISSEKNLYRLLATGQVTLRVRLGDAKQTEMILISRLRETMGERIFSAKEAEIALGISSRAARRLLQESTTRGEIKRHGARRGARYQFVSVAWDEAA